MSDALYLTEFVRTECDNVARMHKPLNEDQAKALLKLYPLDALKSQFQKMDNYMLLRKKYTSAYLTCLKWFDLDVKKGFYSPPAADKVKDIESRETHFFKKHPIGSKFISKTGRHWLVENRTFLRCLDDDSCLPIATLLKYNDSS
jgi:hypothetical protein